LADEVENVDAGGLVRTNGEGDIREETLTEGMEVAGCSSGQETKARLE